MFKQKKPCLLARFGIYILSFLLGVTLFATALTTALIGNIRVVTSQDSIQGLITQMISAPQHVQSKAPAAPVAGGLRIAPRTRTYQMPRREEPGDVANNLTQQLIDMFYEGVSEQLGEEFPVTKEEFVQMIEESTVKDYVTEKTAALITDYFNDEVTTTFEPEEIMDLINENKEIIIEITGQPIPEDIAEQVAKVFNENEIILKVEEEGLAGFMDDVEIPGLGQLTGEEGSFSIRDILDTVRNFASKENLTWGIIICVVLVLLILLINCRQLTKGLRRAAYPLMLAGLLVVLNILAKAMPELWVTASSEVNMILKPVHYILLRTAWVNGLVFGSGVLLFVASIVLGIVLRAQRKKPAKSAPAPVTPKPAPAVAAAPAAPVVKPAATPAAPVSPIIVKDEEEDASDIFGDDSDASNIFED